jgi:integrase
MLEKKYSYKFVIRLDRENSDKMFPMYLKYTYLRKSKNIPLGESIRKNHFVPENGTIKPKCPNFEELILKMSNLEKLLKEVIEDYYNRKNEYPKTENISDLIKDFSKKKKVRNTPKQEKKSETIDELFQKFLEFKRRSHIENSTFKIYNQFWTKWKEFEENTKSYIVSDMKRDVFNEFEIFLVNQKLQINSVGKQMKTLKTFLGYVSSITEIPNDYTKIVVHREHNDFVVLTENEVELLSREVIYSNFIKEGKVVKNKPRVELNERERLIGRIFLFLCSTGLSYVDFNKLTINNIFVETDEINPDDKMIVIKITRQKVKNTTDCEIPILDRTIDLIFLMLGYVYYKKDFDYTKNFYESKDKILLLSKSLNHIKEDFPNLKEYRIFPKVPDQKFNKEIKGVLKKIGINNMVKINKKVKNVVSEENVPKYELVSSHTGRRTYITWCKSNDIDNDIIMKTTGHKNTQTLNRYNKTNTKRVYDVMSDKLNESQKKYQDKQNKSKDN